MLCLAMIHPDTLSIYFTPPLAGNETHNSDLGWCVNPCRLKGGGVDLLPAQYTYPIGKKERKQFIYASLVVHTGCDSVDMQML